MRKILIRFDDICPTMDWEEWRKATEILDKYDIRPLIGVIPDCKDPDLLINSPREDFWEYLLNLKAKGYTIAMHGCYHVFDNKCKGIVTNNYNTEFSGHPYEEQLEKIKKGKEILKSHGIETDIFFAPAHSYDLTTIKVLRDVGFKYISDGKSKKIIDYDGIKAIPCRASGCPKIKKSGYFTAVFHAHEWKRQDKAYAYNQLIKLCESYEKDIVSFDEYLLQPIGNFFVQKLEEKMYLFWSYFIKPFLSKLKNKLIKRKIK